MGGGPGTGPRLSIPAAIRHPAPGGAHRAATDHGLPGPAPQRDVAGLDHRFHGAHAGGGDREQCNLSSAPGLWDGGRPLLRSLLAAVLAQQPSRAPARAGRRADDHVPDVSQAERRSTALTSRLLRDGLPAAGPEIHLTRRAVARDDVAPPDSTAVKSERAALSRERPSPSDSDTYGQAPLARVQEH